MKTITLMGTGLVIGLTVGDCSSYHTGKRGNPLEAKATIAGPGISGEATSMSLIHQPRLLREDRGSPAESS